MKAGWRTFGGLGLFLVPWTVLYWLAAREHAGALALAGTVAALVFLGSYLYVQARRVGERPEDRPDGDAADAAGDVGEFPSSSPWPAVLGIGASLMGYGLAFSQWVAVPGLLLLLSAVAGYAAESQRARHSRH